MKNTLAVILGFFILLFAYTKIAGPIPFSVTSVTTQKTDTFSVTGEGKISVTPDIATITLGVQTQGTTVKSAQDQLNTKINNISASIKKTGVDAKDIQTSGYNIFPTYNYNGSIPVIQGYQAQSNLTVKVRKIDNTNQVIDASTASGANQVSGISFDVDDPTKAQNDARTLAVADAKKKAEDAARIAGFKLGRVINYSENFGSSPRPVPLLAKSDAAVGLGGAAPVTNVEPGSNEIVVDVTLSYQIQ